MTREGVACFSLRTRTLGLSPSLSLSVSQQLLQAVQEVIYQIGECALVSSHNVSPSVESLAVTRKCREGPGAPESSIMWPPSEGVRHPRSVSPAGFVTSGVFDRDYHLKPRRIEKLVKCFCDASVRVN